MLRIGPAILFIFLANSAFSQSQEITKAEFSRSYFDALDKAREVNRRLFSSLKTYRHGEIVETEEWLYEYVNPIDRRLQYIKTANGKASRTHEINVDGNIFCKFGDTKWKRNSTNCLTGFVALKSQESLQVGGIVSSKFSVERVDLDGFKTRVYTEDTKYKNQSPANKDAGRLRFMKSRFWLDDKGLILKQESTLGLLGEKQISSLWVDVYEYDPKDVKILPPIN